jgi:N-acetylglutamate synthase-like GNAT family acetyltransferase
MLIRNWKIRKATVNDANYFHQSLEQIHALKIDIEVFIAQFKKKLKNRNALFYVIETNIGNQIGCICCEKEEKLTSTKQIIQIKEFYISPAYRKLNIADELFTYIYEKSIHMSVEKIEVLCNLNATITQNFYLRKKFTPSKKLFVKNI